MSIFVADMQTSFNGIGDWEQVQPENVKVIQKVTGHLANDQLPGCWSIQQKILSVQNEDLYKQRKAEWEPVLSSYFNLSNPKKYIGENGNELSQWEWSKPIGAMAFNIHLKNNRLNEVQKENKRCVPIVKNAMEQANELIAKGEMPAGGFNFPDK